MDAHLIGIDLAQFLPAQNSSTTKEPPAKPGKSSAQSDMNNKKSHTKPH
jgi:hypothetical protein